MKSHLPPLRSLQAFEAFGRLGSIAGAAQELNVTPGAISQHLKALENHVGVQIILKDGRKSVLTSVGRSYFELLASGFDRFAKAQTLIEEAKTGKDLRVSGLPTLLLKWLNPHLQTFQTSAKEVPVRLVSTYAEPDRLMIGEMFRLTYGAVARQYPYFRELFTDICFPVCSPEFADRHPHAMTLHGLRDLPYFEIDWGPNYPNVPRWRDWFLHHQTDPPDNRPVSVHSLSGSALEAAAAGQGVVLAQHSFARLDLMHGRLVRLSEKSLPMPEPYYVCWGEHTLEQPAAREFLVWLEGLAAGLSQT
ncbi:LysR family transcriptional regulator [Rhodophyticola sp. CCM32]|uniref:LysR family transcriptional regulator n=1 Tax=Rhodophyticola sp. CCM32 TaxID=2916397 RepID=UPI00143CFA02|nr:LysR family transcriptional regulator [Rhodophyticola sp. CCM32]